MRDLWIKSVFCCCVHVVNFNNLYILFLFTFSSYTDILLEPKMPPILIM